MTFNFDYMDKIKIFVATHKIAPKYGDSCYQMIHVGAETSNIEIPNAIKDNCCSDNISTKNNIYCELTGLYHVWKNVSNVTYVGLCHYRRLPAMKVGIFGKTQVLSGSQMLELLESYDVILPNKAKKNGVLNGFFADGDSAIESYRPYKLMLPVVQELYPDYLDDFKAEFHTPEMSFGNIMVCSKKLFDAYCKWLFDVLFRVEQNVLSSGDKNEPRELGYYSEWLLNVWVRHQNLKVKYVPLFLPERPSFVRRIMNKLQK